MAYKLASNYKAGFQIDALSLASDWLISQHQFGNASKLTDELFYFVHLIGNQKMNAGDYNQAEKLFQDAYAMRDNISKDNKVGFEILISYWSDFCPCALF